MTQLLIFITVDAIAVYLKLQTVHQFLSVARSTTVSLSGCKIVGGVQVMSFFDNLNT
jgi:hypothetical protein